MNPAQKPKFASITAVKMVDDPAQKVKMVVEGGDKATDYAWETLRDTLIYTVNRIPEIADDIVNVDNAMKWGFNWEIGPFEMLDAIGVDGIRQPGGKGRRGGSRSVLKTVESFYRFNEAGKRNISIYRPENTRAVPA